MYGWGHHYGFASNIGHPRLNSIGLLVYDDMRQYSRHRYCTTGLVTEPEIDLCRGLFFFPSLYITLLLYIKNMINTI
jgi:hypothetical protein